MKYLLVLLLFFYGCSEASSNEDSEKKQKESTEKEVQDSASLNDERKKDKQDVPKEVNEKDCDVSIDAYIDDPSETATNVRKTPGGEVVLKLEPNGDYFLTIVAQDGNWFKVSAIDGIEDSFELPSHGAWVHNSVVGAGTSNYGNQKITMYKHDTEKSEVVGTIDIESGVHILRVCQQWVQVELIQNKKVGWIKKEWICGNPLTTCS